MNYRDLGYDSFLLRTIPGTGQLSRLETKGLFPPSAFPDDTLTGLNFTGTSRTATTGQRIIIDRATNTILIYDDSGDYVGAIYGYNGDIFMLAESNVYVSTPSGALLADNGIELIGEINIDGNIIGPGIIQFTTQSSNPTASWAIYGFSSGATKQLRARVDGVTYSVNLTAV
jgi:hypothetical protein